MYAILITLAMTLAPEATPAPVPPGWYPVPPGIEMTDSTPKSPVKAELQSGPSDIMPVPDEAVLCSLKRKQASACSCQNCPADGQCANGSSCSSGQCNVASTAPPAGSVVYYTIGAGSCSSGSCGVSAENWGSWGGGACSSGGCGGGSRRGRCR